MNRNPEVDGWFDEKDHPMDAAMRRRDIILGADDRVTESIKWKTPTFAFEGNIASFNPSKRFVSLLSTEAPRSPGTTRGWSPEGQMIATSSLDETVRIWDATTGELVSTLVHDGAVVTADWSPDSTRLVTGGGNATVWEITGSGGRELFSLAAQDMNSGIQGVAFSPDGDRVMAGDGGITAVKVWDVGRNGDAEWLNAAGDPGWISSVAFAQSGGEVLASGGDGSVAFWSLDTGERLRSFEPHGSSPGSDSVWALDLSPDSTLVATTGTDEAARVWDAATGEELFSFPLRGYGEDVDWSPDGRLLAIAAEDQGVVEIEIVDDRVKR